MAILGGEGGMEGTGPLSAGDLHDYIMHNAILFNALLMVSY